MNRKAVSPGSKRDLGLDPLVLATLAGAIAFFLISGFVAFRNLQTLRANSDAIVHTGEVIIALDQLLSGMQDAETGQRGYLLVGDGQYLEPYAAAVDSIAGRIDEIERLTADNAVQQARIPALRLRVQAKLAELQETVDLRGAQGFEAAMVIVTTDRGKAEMDAVRGAIQQMTADELGLRSQRRAEMEQAYTSALFSSLLAGALGVGLTIMVGVLVRRATIARRLQDWLQAGEAGLASVMLGNQSAAELGDNILGFLAKYSGAAAGAVFMRDHDHYRRIATYGVPSNANVPERFTNEHGLLGQAVRENRQILIPQVPEGYLSFGSALGQATPRHIVIAPAGVGDSVNAVVELGFIHPIDGNVLALLDQSVDAMALAVRSANYRAELQELLEDTQRKSEELQVQGEELRVSNEELEEQGKALKDSHARLEQQQAELEQTNSQLEEQAQQLEVQRDELERANTSVQLKARELEQASRYKSDFLANMSHELRTPLNSSLILAKLLGDNPQGNLTQEQVKYAQTIQSSGNDLLTLINDILDLSKIEAGHVDIRPEQVVLQHMAERIRLLFQPIAKDKGLQFSIDITAECPAIVTTDPQRLDQILKNLLSNAFKFTEAGGIEFRISRARSGHIALAIVDSGVGIPEDQQQLVFEAFRQADGTISRKYGGTGLGLSISRELARLLGGSIQLSSVPGQGSTFTVFIPEHYDPATIAPREVKPPVAMTPMITRLVTERVVPVRPVTRKVLDDRASLGDRRRVLLIVEDDDIFASLLRDLSREMKFQSLVAGTAEEAMNLAVQYLPSAIILDIGLPDQSGLSVLDRLKRDVRTRHIPVHVVSAHDHARTALSLGAVGYMVKPAQPDQIFELLRKMEARLSQRMHRVLVVEDDQMQREAVQKLLSAPDVEIVTVGTAAECLQYLKEQTFDCMVLDLSLPDASGYSLLETLSLEDAYSFPPVIVYTGHDLSADEEQQLRRYSSSIIIKGAKSPERLLDEVALFLHQVVSDLPDEQQKMIHRARNRDALLEGRRILIAEDDIRNVYALSNILEPQGATVEIARNGQEALNLLEKAASGGIAPVDLVLMDVMMPVMDGLTAVREIRKNSAWKKLPIIVLTAKAMPGDQERCIEAGANDYMPKPLDVEKLLSLVRVWLPR